MKRPKRLSDTFIRTVKVPGRYGDGRGGHGLNLLVKPMSSGGYSKSFSQRLRLNGKPFNVGIGPYPIVTLAEAREQALENARAVYKGIDIRRERKRKPVPTFEAASETVIGIHAKMWKPGSKTERYWRSRLAEYAYPKIGDMPVSGITTSDVLSILLPIWAEKRETATKIRQYMGAVFKWAVVEGHRADNPAGDVISEALPKTAPPRRHQRALPFADVSHALGKVQASDAWKVTKLALEFLTLTATRSGEVREAIWDEIDLNTRTWTIPAERTKGQREHRIPLSDRAMVILEQALAFGDASGLVFPSQRGKVMSDNTLSKLLRDLQIQGTPHGMRSSFRDWAAEKTDYPSEIAEHALAHIEGTATERAYRRTDYFDIRRGLMEAWSDYLTDRSGDSGVPDEYVDGVLSRD